MKNSMNTRFSSSLQADIDDAASHLTAIEDQKPDGALWQLKNMVMGMRQQATSHLRAVDRIVLRALQTAGVEIDAQAVHIEALLQRVKGIEEGLSLIDTRLSQLERRTARGEAMLATLATDLSRLALGTQGEGTGGRAAPDTPYEEDAPG